MIIALPVRDGSAALVAVRVTGFVAGTADGATKSMLPEAGMVGGRHGFEPCWHTNPSPDDPLATPLTAHDSAVFVVFVTVGVKVWR